MQKHLERQKILKADESFLLPIGKKRKQLINTALIPSILLTVNEENLLLPVKCKCKEEYNFTTIVSPVAGGSQNRKVNYSRKGFL